MEPNLNNRFNPKNLILVFLLVFLLIVIMLVQIFRGTNPQNPGSTQNSGTFSVVGAEPNNLTVTDMFQTFEVTFSEAVSIDRLRFRTDPLTPLKIIQKDPKTLKFTAADLWKNQTSYIITILKLTSSSSNKTLDKDFEIKFSTQIMMDYPEL